MNIKPKLFLIIICFTIFGCNHVDNKSPQEKKIKRFEQYFFQLNNGFKLNFPTKSEFQQKELTDKSAPIICLKCDQNSIHEFKIEHNMNEKCKAYGFIVDAENETILYRLTGIEDSLKSFFPFIDSNGKIIRKEMILKSIDKIYQSNSGNFTIIIKLFEENPNVIRITVYSEVFDQYLNCCEEIGKSKDWLLK